VIADDRLDDEVEAIAARLARFDHDAMARTKSYVDRVTLPPDSEFPRALADFFEMLGRPELRAQNARLESLGLNTNSEFERSLGRRAVESLSDACVSARYHDSKPTRKQVADRNPHHVEAVAVLEVDHLTESGHQHADDRVQEHPVRQICTGLIYVIDRGTPCGATIRRVEGVSAIEHGIAEAQFDQQPRSTQPQSAAVPRGGLRTLDRRQPTDEVPPPVRAIRRRL